MFARFTDRCRKVMALANQEAQLHRDQFIRPEHILCGIIKEIAETRSSGGVAANVLKTLGVDFKKLKALIPTKEATAGVGRLEQTNEAKKVVEHAIHHARRLGHNYVGTEHLLLGLMDDSGTLALLNQCGVTEEDVERTVLELVGAGGGEASIGGVSQHMFQRFTDRCRRVMAFANQEAQAWKHDYIGTEHILLGILKDHDEAVVGLLNKNGVTVEAVRNAVGELIRRGLEREMGAWQRLPQTPRAKRTIEYAVEEAQRRNHEYVGVVHMLAGLLREEDGVAAQVLHQVAPKLRGEVGAYLDSRSTTTSEAITQGTLEGDSAERIMSGAMARAHLARLLPAQLLLALLQRDDPTIDAALDCCGTSRGALIEELRKALSDDQGRISL